VKSSRPGEIEGLFFFNEIGEPKSMFQEYHLGTALLHCTWTVATDKYHSILWCQNVFFNRSQNCLPVFLQLKTCFLILSCSYYTAATLIQRITYLFCRSNRIDTDTHWSSYVMVNSYSGKSYLKYDKGKERLSLLFKHPLTVSQLCDC